eukprot:PhM_4_TR19085/c0_g1_i1/m.96420
MQWGEGSTSTTEQRGVINTPQQQGNERANTTPYRQAPPPPPLAMMSPLPTTPNISLMNSRPPPHLPAATSYNNNNNSPLEFLLCVNARRRYHEHHRNVAPHRRLQLSDASLQKIATYLKPSPPMMLAQDRGGMRGAVGYSPASATVVVPPEPPVRSPIQQGAQPQSNNNNNNSPSEEEEGSGSVAEVLFPKRSVYTETTWRPTSGRAAIAAVAVVVYVLQAVLFGVFLDRHESSGYLALIALDAVCVLLMLCVFYLSRMMHPNRSVDLVRYVWVVAAASSLIKMFVMYSSVTPQRINSGNPDTFDGTTSFSLATYLTAVLYLTLLGWCVAATNNNNNRSKYDPVNTFAAVTFTLSLLDLMDGLDLFSYHIYTKSLNLSAAFDQSVCAFTFFSCALSPFFAFCAASECNTTSRVLRRFVTFVELHILFSCLIVSLPILCLRLYLYYEHVAAPASVFIVKDLLVVVACVCDPCAIRVQKKKK